MSRGFAPSLNPAQVVELLTAEQIVEVAVQPGERKIGLYFLIKDGELKYVGQSIDIEARICSHRWREFDRWHWIPCEKEQLNALERAYIDSLLPPWNTDSRTAKKRGDSYIGQNSLPSVSHPLEGVDPVWWDADGQDEIDKEVWTQDALSRERMRRLRAVNQDRTRRVEDFGPMPKLGNPLVGEITK
jgi:hypothetical protein